MNERINGNNTFRTVSASNIRNERLAIVSVCINMPERDEGFLATKKFQSIIKIKKKTIQ